MDAERLDYLLSAYLAGGLTDAEGRELADAARRDETLRARLADLALVQRLLPESGPTPPRGTAEAVLARLRTTGLAARAETITEADRPVGMRASQSRARPRGATSWMPWLAAAAVLALVVGGVLLWSSNPPTATQPATLAHLAQTGDRVEVLRGGGSTAAAVGTALQDGDVVACGGGTAALAYDDGTRIDLAVGASLTVRSPTADAAKLLELTAGHLTAAVAPQVGKPLVVATPQATVTVIGTRFDVTVADGGTAVEVANGRVLLQRRDGTGIELGAGQHALAKPGEPFVTDVRKTLDADADGWVAAARPHERHGSDAVLVVSGPGSPKGQEIAVVRFLVEGRPRAATLVLQCQEGEGTGEIRISHREWDEATLQHEGYPAHEAGPVATWHSKAGEATTVDVSALVTGPGPITFIIFGGPGTLSFASREAKADRGPTLELRY